MTKPLKWRVKRMQFGKGDKRKLTTNYYLCYGRKRIVTPETNKEAAERWARESLGLAKPKTAVDHSKVPIAQHLVVFEADMDRRRRRKSAIKISDEWRELVKTRIRRLIDGCGWVWLEDLSATGAAAWLESRLAADAMSLQTRTHYIRHIKFFGKWLVRTKRLASSPFEDTGEDGQELLETHSPDCNSPDRKLIRRYLTVEEFGELRAAAEKSRQFQRIKGRDRSVCYLLAAVTGLRRREISSLVPESFDFGTTPKVTLLGTFAKNRKTAECPLPEDVVIEIKEWLVGKKPGKPVLPIAHVRTADMIRFDMKRAGFKDAGKGAPDYRNRVIDFHALRTTFGSHMALNGLDLSTAQKLMRHSTPVLTANVYQVAGIKDLQGAVNKGTAGLAAKPTPRPAAQATRKRAV